MNRTSPTSQIRGIRSNAPRGVIVPVSAMTMALGITIVVPVLAALIFVGLVIWGFRGYREAIQSLTVAWLVTSLNPALFAGSPAMRWLVIVGAAGSVVYHYGPTRSLRLFRESGLGVAVLLLLPSVVFSIAFELAMFKLVGFTVGAFAIVGLLMSRPVIDGEWLNQWFAALFWVVVLASLPLVVSDLGYVRNGSGFQGVLNHPQTLGVFLAPYTVVFIVSWLTRAPVPFSGAGAALALILLPLTQARVGAVAAGAGIAVAFMVSWLWRRGSVFLVRRRVVLAGFGVIALVFLTFAVGHGGIVQDFATKSRSESLFRSFEISRGQVVEDSIESFKESPIVGRGLGVPRRIDDEAITTVAGFPVGAPVEAGFAVTGLLEQAGMLGFLGIGVLLAKTIWPTIRFGPMSAVALATTALLTNLGEATITSFGGLGLFVWLMMGWAVVLARGHPQGDETG